MQAIESPYEFYGSTLCVRKPFLTDEAKIISLSQYNNYVDRGHLNVLRPGRGKGNYALIEFESMYPEVKQKVESIEKPEDTEINILKPFIKPDNAAITFFVNHRKPDGSSLTPKEQLIKCTSVIILNAITGYIAKHRGRMKVGKMWNNIHLAVNSLEGYEFKLPKNIRAIQRAHETYIANSYMDLIHGNEGNINSRIVNERIENLILSIYSMHNNPFVSTVHEIYNQFLKGTIEIVDKSTGEIIDPLEFSKNGKPLTISEGTIWNILNDPINRIVVDSKRSDAHRFNNEHRPHVNRHAPKFSLSKISLDDRDLPRKMLDGKRVKAYYAYDVTSGCVVGASYSKDKDDKLFLDCVRDMLKFLKARDLGIPMEMEVEHHLVNHHKDDLFKAGIAFPFVRWCNAGNSQEKHAEHLNKAKKYGYEKRYQDGIGRWYAKSEAHRTRTEKIFDSENNNYKEKLYEYNALVADDLEIIELYNNGLHPNKKLYPGLTRMQVLMLNVNPDLSKLEDVTWARFVGKKVGTTIRRSMYVTVQYNKYQLPSPKVLSQLAPNKYEVDAYYLENETGEIESVSLYQDDKFICECQRIVTFNTATAERTDQDTEAYQNQAKYISEFDGDLKKDRKERISPLKLIENKYPELPPATAEITHEEQPIIDEGKEFTELLELHEMTVEEDKILAKTNI